MENEIMNYDEVMDNEVEATETENSGMSTGAAMLVGAGLTLATAAVVKLGKKLCAKIRAKKEKEEEVDEHDFVEVTDEEVKNVTK